jgi:hypothetical protein
LRSSSGALAKSTLLAAGILGGTLVLAIGAQPANAQFSGTLGWTDGTLDFYADAVDDGNFTVVFDNFPADPNAAITTANGVFVPPFTAAPQSYFADLLDDPIGNFAGPTPQPLVQQLYTLTNDLVFLFDTDSDGIFAEAEVTLPSGSIFEGQLNASNALEFELDIGNWEVRLDRDGDDIYDTQFVNISSVLEFGQVPGSSFGVYAAQDITGVPGPLPIFGAGIAFGFSRRLRHRISQSQSTEA